MKNLRNSDLTQREKPQLSQQKRGCDLGDRIHQRNIVVVSHVSPIKAAVAWALGVTMEIMFHCHLAQASLCRIDRGRFGPVLHSFNEQAPPVATPAG